MYGGDPTILLCVDESTPPFLTLSPNIHIQILQTDLHTFPNRVSGENLIADQSIFCLAIIS